MSVALVSAEASPLTVFGTGIACGRSVCVVGPAAAPYDDWKQMAPSVEEAYDSALSPAA